jgi:hypothetical protein
MPNTTGVVTSRNTTRAGQTPLLFFKEGMLYEANAEYNWGGYLAQYNSHIRYFTSPCATAIAEGGTRF